MSYSAISAPVAGLLGNQLTEVLSAAGAAWAFDRLVIGHFGPIARTGSLMFAVGTLAQVAIGQLPFLLGEALALVGSRRPDSPPPQPLSPRVWGWRFPAKD